MCPGRVLNEALSPACPSAVLCYSGVVPMEARPARAACPVGALPRGPQGSASAGPGRAYQSSPQKPAGPRGLSHIVELVARQSAAVILTAWCGNGSRPPALGCTSQLVSPWNGLSLPALPAFHCQKALWHLDVTLGCPGWLHSCWAWGGHQGALWLRGRTGAAQGPRSAAAPWLGAHDLPRGSHVCPAHPCSCRAWGGGQEAAWR